MSVFKDDQTTYTGNLTVLGSFTANGSLTIGGDVTVTGNTIITGTLTVGGKPIVGTSPITNSLSGDVAMNAGSLATYFNGPTVAQGTVGTWFAVGTISLVDTGAIGRFNAKLWDGTTIFATAQTTSSGANLQTIISVSGFLASPAANIRIDCSSLSATGKMLFNATGNSKDSTISAIRVA